MPIRIIERLLQTRSRSTTSPARLDRLPEAIILGGSDRRHSDVVRVLIDAGPT